MKPELTESDVFLLKIALSVLIAFVFIQFFIMPGLIKLQDNAMKGDDLEETASSMQTSIGHISHVEKQIEKKQKELEEGSVDFYEKMENREVDELLTGIALKYGLFPSSLSIEEAVPTSVNVFLEEQEEVSSQAADAQKEPGTGGYMQRAVGRLTLYGDKKGFMSFLSDVEKNYPAILLKSVNVNERAYFDEEWTLEEQFEMNCELAVYMYDRGSVDGEGGKGVE